MLLVVRWSVQVFDKVMPYCHELLRLESPFLVGDVFIVDMIR